MQAPASALGLRNWQHTGLMPPISPLCWEEGGLGCTVAPQVPLLVLTPVPQNVAVLGVLREAVGVE